MSRLGFDGKRVLIIAEAGVNHNGSREFALQLVDAAADAGADIVKFQTFKATSLATSAAAKADYQVTNTKDDGSQIEMLRKLELSTEDHRAIAERARLRGIGFLSTAFDPESMALLSKFDMPIVKIPSGDIVSIGLLLASARSRKPLVVSTGMATLGDIEQALGVIAFGYTTDRQPDNMSDFEQAYCSRAGQESLKEKVTLLHCVTDYPAAPETVNLRAMESISRAFGVPVGYSDHTRGIEVSLAAVALGATIIEKHFTLDTSMPGPDHAASLEPAELAQLVSSIRVIEKALGYSEKKPSAAEVRNRAVVRRSLVAARDIAKGEILTAAMLIEKRPGIGLAPNMIWSVLGKPASRDYKADDLIEL